MLSTKEKQVINYIESKRDEIISFVCNLIRIPSINPPGDERDIVRLIQDKFRDMSLGKSHIIAKLPERPNIIFSLKGREDGNKIFLNGHLDTKPVGNKKEWKTNPFAPEIIGERLFGLGSSDMKGAIGSLVYALASIKKCAPIEKGELKLILTADEEGGSKFGAHYLSKEYNLDADIGLVAEAAGVMSSWEKIYLVARRNLGFKIKIYGTQIHSSLSDIVSCINANEKMVQVISKMVKDMEFKIPIHRFYPQGITKNIAIQMKGGVYYGVNPGYAEFKSELRLPPGVSFKDIFTKTLAFIDSLKEEDPDLKIEVVQEIPDSQYKNNYGWEVSEKELFVKDLKTSCREVLGFAPPAGGFPGGTDAAIFQGETGIPTIPAFGPGLLSVCHQPNEFVFVEDIICAAKIYAISALKYLNR